MASPFPLTPVPALKSLLSVALSSDTVKSMIMIPLWFVIFKRPAGRQLRPCWPGRTAICNRKALAKYANPRLLILDEWLLLKPTETEQHDILELLHARRKTSSTIFCSQYHDSGWYDQLGGDDSPLAEAILDRIKHDAYKINIVPTNPANYRSMREVYGLDKSLSE